MLRHYFNGILTAALVCMASAQAKDLDSIARPLLSPVTQSNSSPWLAIEAGISSKVNTLTLSRQQQKQGQFASKLTKGFFTSMTTRSLQFSGSPLGVFLQLNASSIYINSQQSQQSGIVNFTDINDPSRSSAVKGQIYQIAPVLFYDLGKQSGSKSSTRLLRGFLAAGVGYMSLNGDIYLNYADPVGYERFDLRKHGGSYYYTYGIEGRIKHWSIRFLNARMILMDSSLHEFRYDENAVHIGYHFEL